MIRFINTLWIYLICVVLTIEDIYQIAEHEAPCILCMLQILSLLIVAIGPMLNLRFTTATKNYALSIGGCLFGGYVSLRQIALHACPEFPKYGYPLLGLELYVWAFIFFALSVAIVMLLLIIHPKDRPVDIPFHMPIYEKAAFVYIFVLSIMNIVTTISECGFGACSV